MITRPKRKTVAVRVEEELIAHVDTEAERLFMSRADILRMMISYGKPRVLEVLADREDVPPEHRF